MRFWKTMDSEAFIFHGIAHVGFSKGEWGHGVPSCIARELRSVSSSFLGEASFCWKRWASSESAHKHRFAQGESLSDQSGRPRSLDNQILVATAVARRLNARVCQVGISPTCQNKGRIRLPRVQQKTRFCQVGSSQVDVHN